MWNSLRGSNPGYVRGDELVCLCPLTGREPDSGRAQAAGFVNPAHRQFALVCIVSAGSAGISTRLSPRVASTQWRVLREILKRSRSYADVRSIPEFSRASAAVRTHRWRRPIPCCGRVADQWHNCGNEMDSVYGRHCSGNFNRGIRALDLWICSRHNPAMLGGRSYGRFHRPGRPAMNLRDDTEYLGRARRLVASTLAVPVSVRHIAKHRGVAARYAAGTWSRAGI